MTESLADKIKRLELELQKEKEKNANVKTDRAICLKVSTKGAVQINGIRRFPITLYKQEIEKILGMKDDIEEFIRTNGDQLSSLPN